MALLEVGNTIIEHHPRPEDETFLDATAFGQDGSISTIRVLADILHPDLSREFCLLLGGTLVSVESEDGARPGMGVEELLRTSTDVRFSWDRFGQIPRLVLPLPESPYYFGQPMDSSQMQPEDFARVAEICHGLCSDSRFDRITIITGTDTAEYLGAALGRMLTHPSKPILIIAAMKTPAAAGSDALPNFHLGRYFNAHLDPGVFLYLDQDAHDVRRVTKSHSIDTNSFQSLGAKPVATFRHDWHPFIEIGLNYLSREEIVRLRLLHAHAEQVWDFCQRRKIPHPDYPVNFHLYEPDQKDRAIADLRSGIDEQLARFDKLGMLPSDADIRFPPAPILNTKFDNLVYCERLTPGYRSQWLAQLLERDDIHGVVLTEARESDSTLQKELIPIISSASRSKPVVLLEDPEARESQRVRAFYQEAARAGAILSGGLTLAYGTFALKWLLGQGLDLHDLRTAYGFAEHVGGPGYIRTNTGALTGRQPELPHIRSAIRYIHLLPGYEPEWLESILDDSETEAVVVGAFGTGNIPFSGARALLPILEENALRIPIVVRTQCAGGPTDLIAYEPGVLAQRAGVLSAEQRSLGDTFRELDFLIQNCLDVRKYWGKQLPARL